MYKNILIAADGSENSLRATQQAADIASLLVDAKVELVSVIAIDVYSDMVYDPIEAHGEAQREILEALRPFCQMRASTTRLSCCMDVLPTRSSATRRSRVPTCS